MSHPIFVEDVFECACPICRDSEEQIEREYQFKRDHVRGQTLPVYEFQEKYR